jgi:uncharacterized protein (PEP-CTERM system associated)
MLGLGVFLTAGSVSQQAVAGDWRFDHSTTVELSHVDRSGDDGYSGQILQATPNLHVHGEGGRFSADVNYQPTVSVGNSDTDPEFLTHNGIGRAQLEAVEDRFFIGADSTARLTGDSSSSASVDAVNYNSENGQQVFTFGLTPEYRHHINQYADFVSRNRFDWVTYSGNNSGNNDSRSQTFNAQIRDGRYFSIWDWSLDATQRKTFYDSDQDNETRTQYTANLGYRLSPRWALNGSVGYEDNDINTDRSNTNDFIWDVGATWTPNARTRASAEYGQRYFGDRIRANVSHRTRRTRLQFDVTREVENRRNQELADSYFFLADSNGNPIIDPATGSPIIANIPDVKETDEDFINTQVRGIVTVTGRRTTLTLTGSYSDRNYEESPSDEDTYSLSARATRNLGSNYSASLSGRAERVESNNSSDNETYDANFSLRKALSPRSSTALTLGYRDYNDDNSSENYTEKRIGISFTTTYL